MEQELLYFTLFEIKKCTRVCIYDTHLPVESCSAHFASLLCCWVMAMRWQTECSDWWMINLDQLYGMEYHRLGRHKRCMLVAALKFGFEFRKDSRVLTHKQVWIQRDNDYINLIRESYLFDPHSPAGGWPASCASLLSSNASKRRIKWQWN